MKAIDKNNKIAKEERERAKNKKTGHNFYEINNPIYLSQNSHRKTNKRK